MTAALRLATPADIGAVARLHREVRRACLPYLPDLHTAEEDERFFRQQVFPTCEVWIAEIDRIIGFCAFRPGWVEHLYIVPDCHGRGIGSALLDKATAAHPHLQLWVFTRNAPAIRLYTARGFRCVVHTDGSRNEEREPDALYEWRRRAV